VIDGPASPLRHEPLVKLASGGMATVFVGALRGALGFRQLVAIKRPHPHLVEDPAFREELLAEAKLASRIHHANVVDVRDVEVVGESLQLVMDYVEGAPLGQLIALGAQGGPRIPPGVAVRIALDACAGLHAAHELVDDAGAPLGLVHRDVSPQNILVGLDGVARVADFGVAKEARSSRPVTTTGTLKGKIGYLAPEYVRGQPIDRRADVFALGVVLWEALTCKRLFRGASEAESLDRVLRDAAPPVSAHAAGLGTGLDAVIARAVEKAPGDRFATARDFGEALEAAARPAGLVAGHAEVARAVSAAVGEEIAERRRIVRERLAAWEAGTPPPAPPLAEVTTHTAIAATSPDMPRPRRRAAVLAVLAVLAALVAILAVALSPRGSPAPVASPAAAPSLSSAPSATASAVVIAPVSASAVEPPPEPARSATPPVKRGVKPLPSNPYR
jgi:serine/threonine-protein kinase